MKKHKLWMAGFSFLFLVLFCVFSIYRERSTVFGIETIEEAKLEELFKGRLLDNEIVLYYNDEEIPKMDSETTYLLSQTDKENYSGRFSVEEGYAIKVVKTSKTKAELMQNNEPLKVIAYSDDRYKCMDVFLTNMPVISLKDERYEYYHFEDGMEYQLAYADMTLYDPIANGGSVVDVTKNSCKYRIRGATSRDYPKQSFKLNLLKKDGDAKDESFFNMREDNDWILNAMYIDDAKVKEYIGYHLWNKLNHNVTPNVQYVELIINDSYRGLYLLQSPMDHKTFRADKEEDFLFSVNNRGYEVEDRYLFSQYVDFEKETNVDEFEIEKAEYIDNRIGFELVRKMYCDVFGCEYTSPYTIQYDVDNFAKYALFLNMIEATDNSYKNQKILFRQKSEYQYLFQKEAWDLDVSMLDGSYEEVDVHTIVEDVLLPKEVKDDPRYLLLQLDYYRQARKSYYNEEYMDRLIDQLKIYLSGGSAITRDMERWGENAFIESIDGVRQFFHDRIAVLDEYYGEER